MADVLSEITELSDKDCFYVVERHKGEFDYPLHRHRECELNFVQNAPGVKRIVGDSVQEIGPYDLVLITGEDVEHMWDQGRCKSRDIREITIHFSLELFPESLLYKNQFHSIRDMFRAAQNGIAFSTDAIMKVYYKLDALATEEGRFSQFLDMLTILYELSTTDYKVLSSGSFSHVEKEAESRRVQKVKQYINAHYADTLNLDTLSGLVGMSPSAFSRFFKQRTGKTISTYIIDQRLGAAARALVDTTRNISEICYSCGFNNISNFNRLFRGKRGMTPKEFRQVYKKQKVLV